MRIDDEAVRQFNAIERVSNARCSEACATVSAIDMHPDLVLMTDLTDTLHIVNDTEVGGASRAGHGKQTFTVYI